jgi:hypothetical protein
MVYEIKNFSGLSDYEDRGIVGAFKFGSNLDVRKSVDSLSCQQKLTEDNGQPSPSASISTSPSATLSNSPSSTASSSPSPSPERLFYMLLQETNDALLQENGDFLLIEGIGSPSPSPSVSKSASPSNTVSVSPSASGSDSKSASPSVSPSTTGSVSISATPSISISATKSASPSNTTSVSRSFSSTPSPSPSASDSVSISASESLTRSASPSISISASVSKSPSASPSPSSSISPSPSALIGASNVFEDLIKFFVKSNDGYTYGFGDTGIIYRRRIDGYWSRLYKDENGEIKGASEWYDDSGHTYLYFATDTVLKRKPLPGLSNWNDVETVGTNLTSAKWHTMRECGGSLIICNSDKLALVGYDGSYTNEAVQLIPGNIATTLVERNGRSIVGCARKSDPTRSINGAIDAEVPLAQVGDDGEIFFANMSDTVPVKRFPGGGKVNPGGVCNQIQQVNFFEWEQTALSWIDKQSVGNLALFGVYNADYGKNGIYSYGRNNKNKPFILNLDYSLEVDEIGAIENIEGVIVASYKFGSYYGVVRVDPSNKATAIYEGLDFKAPVKQPVDITNWKTTELFLSPLPNGSSIEFYYKINKTGDWVRAYTADGKPSFTTSSGKKAVFRIGAEGEIFEPKVILNPIGNETPEVHRIRTYFT